MLAGMNLATALWAHCTLETLLRRIAERIERDRELTAARMRQIAR
jgi:hypothetical protein